MKSNRIILVSILLLIFAVGAVSAADENVTDTTDEVLSTEPVEELEVAQSGTFSELSSLVDSTPEGSTLYLEKDYAYSKSSSKIIISKAITIDGQGHTLDAKNKDGIFFVKNNKVILTNINFINGWCTISSEYSHYGESVTNCSFVDCSGNFGGAINGGDAYNCTFVNCYAYNEGGAISGGNAYNCTFIDCSAKSNGGAIMNGDSYDCTFINCSATNNGGAIYDMGGHGNAYNCSFVNCSANYGGAIYHGNAYDSYFRDCSSKAGSGVICEGTASNCTFVNCKAFIAIESVQSPNVSYGSSAKIYVRGDSEAGYVSVTVNGKTKKIKPTYNGLGNYASFDGLNVGSYEAKVSYAGNDNYEAQNFTSSFRVVKANSIEGMFITPNNYISSGTYSYNTENTTLYIKMKTKDVSGYVNVTINGVTEKINASSVNANYYLEVPLGVLKLGSYKCKVSYAGSANFNAQNKTLSFKIIKENPIISLYVSPWSSTKQVSYCGEKSALIITTENGVSGNMNVTVNDVTRNVEISGSSLTVPLGILNVGSYNIKVSYDGNDYFQAQTMTVSLKVVKSDPIKNIEIMPYKINPYTASKEVKYDGENVSVNIYMRYNNVPGSLNVIVNNVTQKVKISGSTLNVPLGALKWGTYDIKVSYGGNKNFNAQNTTLSFKIIKGNPIVSGAVDPNPVGFGDDAVINVEMLNNEINGNVWFTISDENKTKILTDKIHIENGSATQSIPDLGLGKYYLHLYYAGNAHYNSQTIKGTFEVVKKTPIASVNVSNWAAGEDVKIKVKVNGVNGNIWFTISDENKTKILTDKIHIEDGWANASIANLKAGKYYLHIYYAGNVHYAAQTIKADFEVTRISPNLTVAKRTIDGENVLIANIAKDARGNVNFHVNGSVYKAQIVNGEATASISDLAPGTYTLTTSYAGNYKYLKETKTRSITIR